MTKDLIARRAVAVQTQERGESDTAFICRLADLVRYHDPDTTVITIYTSATSGLISARVWEIEPPNTLDNN